MMNLEKLFETQKILRDRINYNEEDRFNKLVLALLVELGECANEQRSWKFWSKNREPRTYKQTIDGDNGGYIVTNPLLEEYVDGLHFVLELGIELDYKLVILPGFFPNDKTNQFIELYYKVSELNFLVEEFGKTDKLVLNSYQDIFDYYLYLGKSLGFTGEQIETAYYKKNEINHIRQDNGY